MISLYLLLIVPMGILAAPVDEPVRIDLPVYDQPQQASVAYLAKPLETENHPGSKSNSDSGADKSIAHKSKSGSAPIGSVNYGGGLFSPPVTTLEGALLETEGLGSKVLTVNEDVQNLAAGIYQPKPIVDTIQEEEKYGNNGDKFYGAGRTIVNSAEKISNFVNAVLEIPVKVFKNLTRTTTEKLNILGGKLIGL